MDDQLDMESDREIHAPKFGNMIGVAPESSVHVLDWGKGRSGGVDDGYGERLCVMFSLCMLTRV